MPQDTSQKFFIGGVSLIVGVFVLMWLLQKKCQYCKNKCYECEDYDLNSTMPDSKYSRLTFGQRELENYSPYRRTGGCLPRTGYNYLDAYEQEDYYRNYPYIYPTPTNYIRTLYAERRAENAFLKAQSIEMAQRYAEKHHISH